MIRSVLCALVFAASPALAGTRILVVGLDGASWSIIDPMIGAGRLPNLAALKNRGVWGELQSLPARHPNRSNSAAIWTSLATGKKPERHGITDFVRRGADGGLVVMTSADRKEPAFWNDLTMRGSTVGIVGWWATWPAERVNGEMISYDFWPARREGSPDCPGCTVGSRPGRPGPAPRSTSPESLAVELRDLIVYEVDLASGPAVAVQEGAWGLRDYWPYARDLTMAAAAEKILTARSYDLFAVYFESLDIVAHRTWMCRPSEKISVRCPEGEQRARYAERLERYYEFLDEKMGRMIAASGKGATILVVSDHGFETYADSPAAEREFGHSERGIILGAGPGLKPGRVEGSIYDFAPTVLRLAGAPAADDMDGRPLAALLPEGTKESSIAAYPPAPKNDPAAQSPDRAALIERLKSLGYLSQ